MAGIGYGALFAAIAEFFYYRKLLRISAKRSEPTKQE